MPGTSQRVHYVATLAADGINVGEGVLVCSNRNLQLRQAKMVNFLLDTDNYRANQLGIMETQNITQSQNNKKIWKKISRPFSQLEGKLRGGKRFWSWVQTAVWTCSVTSTSVSLCNLCLFFRPVFFIALTLFLTQSTDQIKLNLSKGSKKILVSWNRKLWIYDERNFHLLAETCWWEPLAHFLRSTHLIISFFLIIFHRLSVIYLDSWSSPNCEKGLLDFIDKKITSVRKT